MSPACTLLPEVDRDDPGPFFHGDNLRFIMPVKRDIRKIERNCTWVDIVRKVRRRVGFILFIIIVLYRIHNILMLTADAILSSFPYKAVFA